MFVNNTIYKGAKMCIKRIIFLFMGIFCLFLNGDSSLKIGIAPHSSTRVILETHQDLRIFFEKYFNRPVEILTAKNFSEFAQRCNEGTYYDLIVTSPNLAYLAQKMGGYSPLMTYTKGLTSIIIAKDKDILKNKTYPFKVIGLDPVSFATLTAQEWLETQGLYEGKEVNYLYSSASDSAASILLNNEANMSIMSLPNYLKLPENIKNRVSIIYQSSPKPSRIYLAKSTKGLTLEDWEKALNEFSNSQEGKNHLATTKLEGFKKMKTDDLKDMENVANKTYERLNTK